MNISIWDIFKYLYKWKFLIILAAVISVFLAYGYVNRGQTYNSTAVIQLNDSCISRGQAPDGTDYDYNEIVSPVVMTNVIEELGLSKTVDSLRTRITVSPIIPNSEKEIQESKEKLGENYEYHPNTFSIGYLGRGGESQNKVRDILESVVDNYIEFYTEKYSKAAAINDIAYDEEMGSFDYINMVEMMDNNITDITATLENYYEKDSKFRSTTTGMNFSDIAKQYKYLSEYTISELYSDIYRGQITKDKDLLIKTYTQKKESFLLEKEKFSGAAEIAKSRMESFSAANKEVPNAYNSTTRKNDDDLEIIHEVHDEITPNKTTTTYDTLITSYVDNLADANDKQLQADECDDIISKFQSNIQNGINVDEIKLNVEDGIKKTKLKMSELAKLTNDTIDDYNAYASTAHVSPLTGVNYYASMSFSLYALIAIVAGVFLSVVLVLAYEIIRAIKRAESGEDVSEDKKEESTVGV